MKIPKYIYSLILLRASLAERLFQVDNKLSTWIDKNGIEVDECDYRTGVEMYANPYGSAKRIIESIKNK